MKVLGIAGSPRRGGNTDILLAEFLNGARSRGAETETVFLSQLKMSTCIHCDRCLQTGRCAVKDEMQEIYPKMEAADVIVLASPVQFAGPTAHLKAFIDRSQALWARKYVLKTPPLYPPRERKGFFISVGGRKLPDIFGPSTTIVKTFFRIINVDYAGQLLFPSVDEKGEINQHPDALKQAFEAGQKLAE